MDTPTQWIVWKGGGVSVYGTIINVQYEYAQLQVMQSAVVVPKFKIKCAAVWLEILKSF